ncbi:MAG: hypothetical protein RMK64_08005 [Rhodovarius sp.]|nr:hypothetical protein [Rhodovarius sp.]MDW8314898.1 hypothetical protein [Rhodovarius sp.]
MSGTDPAAVPIRAEAVLVRDGATETLAFDAITISTEDPERLIVALADASGCSLTLLLPRQELKRLLGWRKLLSL